MIAVRIKMQVCTLTCFIYVDTYVWIRKGSKHVKKFKRSKARKDHWNNAGGLLPYLKQFLLSKVRSVRIQNTLNHIAW